VATCLSLAAADVPAAAELNWLDIESRIQYAYYTQDLRALHGVLELLNAAETPAAAKSYYRGLASYRVTQLSETRDRPGAKQAAERCVASLDVVLQARRDDAEALALQAACLDLLAALETWRTPVAASRSGTEAERARQLAPHSPRALLLAAGADYERARTATAAREQALAALKKAAAAFEQERQQPEHTPGWGAAEVYVRLGQAYLDRGDAVNARDSLERALLLAPEYVEARQLMAKIIP
jgi:tetratricopeptide (TPR) repeat protein